MRLMNSGSTLMCGIGDDKDGEGKPYPTCVDARTIDLLHGVVVRVGRRILNLCTILVRNSSWVVR